MKLSYGLRRDHRSLPCVGVFVATSMLLSGCAFLDVVFEALARPAAVDSSAGAMSGGALGGAVTTAVVAGRFGGGETRSTGSIECSSVELDDGT